MIYTYTILTLQAHYTCIQFISCTQIGVPIFCVSDSYVLPVISSNSKERKECFMEVMLDATATSPAPYTLNYTEACGEQPYFS